MPRPMPWTGVPRVEPIQFSSTRPGNYWGKMKTIIGVLAKITRGVAIFSRFVLGCERSERRIVGVSNELFGFSGGRLKHWLHPWTRSGKL